ncbi:hypothetical protein ARMSODRAFT_968768 [Armillaria solidipes]|uniref:Uncharacterized protein n=1 Tax=Armillaria solidipes TaxID=1076256 RepID=A0A2H3C9Y9_9AGAR|nr:hypothetical protein ARMSODRAFT_968768 [Armillaria solidipes]
MCQLTLFDALKVAAIGVFMAFPSACIRVRPLPGHFPSPEFSSSEDDAVNPFRPTPCASELPASDRFIIIHTNDEDTIEHLVDQALDNEGGPDFPISVSSGSNRSNSPIPDDALPFPNSTNDECPRSPDRVPTPDLVDRYRGIEDPLNIHGPDYEWNSLSPVDRRILRPHHTMAWEIRRRESLPPGKRN